MCTAVVVVLIVWAAVFAAVVVEGHSSRSTTAPPPAGYVTPRAQEWFVLERLRGAWRRVRGPFAGPESCLPVSDALNNGNPGSVYDCDEALNGSAAAR
jgi:hypothetical protein